MNRTVIVGMAAAVALCGCGRGRANQQATNTTTAADTGNTPLTVVGCLVPGSPTTQSGAVGTAGTPPPPGFTLVDVTTTSGALPSGNPASGVSGTSGTPGTTPAVDTGTPRSYSLVADKDRLEDLQRYANSRVEVSGMIVASTDTGMGVPDVGAASAPVGAPPTDVQRMRVKDVRQLESTCGVPKR